MSMCGWKLARSILVRYYTSTSGRAILREESRCLESLARNACEEREKRKEDAIERWFSTLGKQICPGLDANEIQIPCDRHHMINMYKRFALFMMKAEEFKRDFRLPEPIFF